MKSDDALYDAHQSAFKLRMDLWRDQRIDPAATICRPVVERNGEVVLVVSVSSQCERVPQLPAEYDNFTVRSEPFDGTAGVQKVGRINGRSRFDG